MPVKLKPVSDPRLKNTTVPPTDGRGMKPDKHFVHSCEAFAKFWKEGADKPTPKIPINIHQFEDDCTVEELFQHFSGQLEKVALYPHQVPAYINEHKGCLVYEARPNIFLIKHETPDGAIQFRLADVRIVANGSALSNRIYTDPVDSNKTIERVTKGRLFTAIAA